MCCDSWGHKELDTTERLNRTDIYTFTHTSIYTHTHVYVSQHTHAYSRRLGNKDSGVRQTFNLTGIGCVFSANM